MDAHFYIKTHSKARVAQVCELAGTKPSWFSLCARGHGVFSIDTAIELEAVSRVFQEQPDDYMTVEELCDIKHRVEARQQEIRQQLIDAA